MSLIFTQDDVDAWVKKNGEDDATELAYRHCEPELREMASAMRKFDRAFKKFRETFSDANIYSANDGLTLLLGSSHESSLTGSDELDQQQRIVHIKNWPGLIYISGGDW